MKFLRRNWAILLVSLLIPLVILLAILQLQWIRNMGERERFRLRQGLFVSAGELASSFQREILLAPWVFAPPQPPPQPLPQGSSGAGKPKGDFAKALATGDWSFFAERWSSWKNNAFDPLIISGVHLARTGRGAVSGLLSWNGTAFVAEGDGSVVERLAGTIATSEADNRRMGLVRVGEEEWDIVPIPGEVGLVLLVRLDLAALAGKVLPALADLHLGAMEDYRFRIFRRDTGAVLYRSDTASGDAGFDQADLRLGLFRQDFAGSSGRNPGAAGTRADPLVFYLRSGASSDHPGPGASPEPIDRHENDALWILEAVHRNGSLASAVRSSTIRSAVASLGILLLLGASLIVLALSNRRSNRLAASQEEFVASVTHELKTPLAVIGSAAENIADGIVSDRAGLARYGSTIGSETRRLVSMIDKLLLYTRLDSGRSAGKDRIDLAALARSVLGEREADLAALHFRVETSIPAAPVPVLGDEAALRHALANLISNVIVHAAAGAYLGVFVKREALRHGPKGGALAVFRVDDRGPGIPRREKRAVFEAFFRGRRARENQEPGSGIGLNLVRRVALAHGGDVVLESTEGFGTSIAIRLPAADTAAAAPEPTPGPDATGDVQPRGNADGS